MSSSYFKAIFVIILMASSCLSVSQAIETDNLQSNLRPMDVTIPISIKLWGFDNVLMNELKDQLPDKIVHEAYNPKYNITSQFGINVFDKPVGQVNNLDIEYDIIPEETFNNVTDIINLVRRERPSQSSPTGGTETYAGYQILVDNIVSQFTKQNEATRYTIHLLNFTNLNDQMGEGSSHWYTVGQTLSITTDALDMRNIFIAGGRGLVFDPTAIAPYFDYNQVAEDQSSLFTYINSGLLDLLEKVVVGSPLTNNYLALEDVIDVASVVVGPAEGSLFYTRTTASLTYLQFKNEVDNLLSYFTIRHKQVNMLVSTIPEYQELIQAYTQQIDGQPTIVVDSQFAERLKNIIRFNYYTEFPRGYFYADFIMLDNDNLRFVYETENGTVEYQVGELGMAINKPYEWFENGIPADIVDDPLRQMLQLFGRVFGLPALDTPFSSQIPSPMSTYGVPRDWDGTFTQFEHDSLDRRIGVLYKTAVEIRMESYTSALDGSIYFWYDTPRFDNATEEILLGDQNTENLDFKNANNHYIEAFKEAKYQVESIDYLTTSVNNGFFLAIFVGVILLYIKYMRDAAITKEELLARVERLKQHKRESSK